MARLAFADALIEPKSVAGGALRYSCCLILEDEFIPTVQAAINAIAKEEFGGKAPTGKDNCLRDGDSNISTKTNEPYVGFAGKMYLSANRAESQGAPLILDNRKDPDTEKPRVIKDKRDDKFPQSGDYVRAKVSIFSLNGKNDKKANAAYGRKICCQLEVVQFAKSGEKFGASRPTTAGFDVLDDSDADAEIGVLA
jgi:hypothetical protein